MSDSDHFVYRPSQPSAVAPGPRPSDHYVYQPSAAAGSPPSAAEAPPPQVAAPAPLAPPAPVEWPKDFEPGPAPARASSAVPIPGLKPWLPLALVGLLTAGAAVTAVLTATHTAVGSTSVAPASSTVHGVVPLGKDMQLVTYKRLQIQVPKSWVRNAICTGHPRYTTVVYLPPGSTTSCVVEFNQGTSEVIFDPPPVTHEPISGVQTGQVTLNSQHGVRTNAVVKRTGQTYSTQVLDASPVNLVVITSDARLAKRILDSARVTS